MKVLNKVWRDKGWVIGLSFIIYHLSFSPAGAQTLLSEYQPGVTQDGAIYRLPKTAVAVTVRAVKTTYTPGDFAKYAQRYLRLNNVSTEPSTKNEVISVQQTVQPGITSDPFQHNSCCFEKLQFFVFDLFQMAGSITQVF